MSSFPRWARPDPRLLRAWLREALPGRSWVYRPRVRRAWLETALLVVCASGLVYLAGHVVLALVRALP